MTAGGTEASPLFDLDVVQDPYPFYEDLRERDPVHEIPGTGVFLVTRADLVKEVTGRPDLFSSRSGAFLHKGDWETPGLRPLAAGYADGDGGGGLAGTDPPDHARQRRVVSRKLSNANVRAMEPEFRTLVEDAIGAAAREGCVEWMGQVAEPLPMVMVTRILGLPDELAPALKKQGYAAVERISGFVSEDRIEQLEAESASGLAPVIDAYASAKASPDRWSGTMIGLLAQAVSDGELDDVEAISILNVLIAAGGESTTSLTGTGARILAERPDLQDRLRGDPSLVPSFVEEACRIDAPFRGHYRVVTRAVQLGGKHLAPGSHLVLVWPAANRDQEAFDDPDEIRLDRPNPRHHLGFGWGIHLCVGAPLARVEAKVAFEVLLARTRRFEIDPEALPLRYHPSLMVRRLVSLPLRLDIA